MNNVKRKYGQTGLVLLNLAAALLVLFPILYALSIGFMKESELLNYPPPLFPNALQFENYFKVFEYAPIEGLLFNSFFIATAITLGQIATAVLGAYAFSHFRFPGKQALFILVLGSLMIPGEATIIVNYLTVASWGGLDTYWALIIPHWATAIGIFLLRQFFLSVPREIHESAVIDGCSSLRFLVAIAVPIARPAIGAIGMYAFIHGWNQYMWPLLVTNSMDKRTVQIGISMLQFPDFQSYGPTMAGVIVILLPSILIFLVGQNALANNTISGAVKG